MKAEELMVGDWVYYDIPNKYYTKIQEIRCTQDGEEYYVRCRRDAKDTFLEQLKYDDFNVDIIHPIPITPEILERNGFTKELDGDSIHCRYTLIADGISFSLKYALSVFQWLGPLDFKYVHELQHALRLCGIEKKIVL